MIYKNVRIFHYALLLVSCTSISLLPLHLCFNVSSIFVLFQFQPSVALPNSRRSPSTDLRPPIAQVTGMYPAMNMMIPGIV